MNCSGGCPIEQGGTPTERPPQPTGCCAWDAELICRQSCEAPNTLACLPALRPGEEGSSQSHEDEGVKRRQRGRPMKYLGDPNALGLDPEQRRQLLRRISNRESARRARARQEQQLASSNAKMKHLQESCNAMMAQIGALEFQCSQLKTLEKRLMEELRVKDEQAEESKHSSNALQSRIHELTLQLYTKEQEVMRLEMQGCKAAVTGPHSQLPCTKVLVKPGSGRLGQNWHPFAPSESGAEHIRDSVWAPFKRHAKCQAGHQAGQLPAGGEAGPTKSSALAVHAPCGLVPFMPCESPQNILSDANMLPDCSSSSEIADCAKASFIFMMREVGLLSDAKA